VFNKKNIHIYFFSFFMFFMFFPQSAFSWSDSLNVKEEIWYVKKSPHFSLYFKENIPAVKIDRYLKTAEGYYDSICKKLHFKKFNFWTWQDRCKIYVYIFRKDYTDNTSRPEWSRASANFKERRIDAFLSDKGFETTLIPHEMGHLIFREFTGGKTPLPLWLEEGVACFVEEEQCSRLNFAKKLVKSSIYIPMKKLAGLDSDTIVVPELFYAQSASIVNYLITGFDEYKFLQLCQALKDRKGWWRSLQQIYGFDDFDDFELKWKTYVQGEE